MADTPSSSSSSVPKITVYGASWCPDCRRAKKFLGEQLIPYTWVDLGEHPEAQGIVEEYNDGKQIIPTIVFEDGSILVEPSNAELATKLGIQTKAKCSSYDLIVVGAGPTGLTAAIYAAREGIDVLVIDRAGAGGQAAITERVDNYPAFPDGISGAEFAERTERQAKRFGVEVLLAQEVTGIERQGTRFGILTGQDATRQGVTGQDATRQGVTGQDATRQGVTGQDAEAAGGTGQTETTETTETTGLADTTGPAEATGPEGPPRSAQAQGPDGPTGIEGPVKADGLAVQTADGSRYSADAVLLATGSTYRRLEVPGEDDFIGAGVHFCATCDGPFYKGRDVAVIGGGNSAAEEAAYLSGIVKSVTVLVRSPALTASKTARDKLPSYRNLTVRYNTAVTGFEGAHSHLTGVRVRSLDEHEQPAGPEETLSVAGAFVFIGLSPNTDFLRGVVALDHNSFISTGLDLQTDIPGVFAGGDCRHGSTKQIASAVGEGATAALMIRHYLNQGESMRGAAEE